MATRYYTFDPEKKHFTGQIFTDEQPDNSTTLAPWCGDWNKYSRWEGDAWVEILVTENGEHVITEEHTRPVNWDELTDIYNEDGTLKEQVIEGETNVEQI